jgi:hypothetical protein
MLDAQQDAFAYNKNTIKNFFSIHVILPAALGPEVYSASNRNVYQKIFLGHEAHPESEADHITVISKSIV